LANIRLAANHLGLFDRRDARSSACRRHIEAFDPVEKNSRPPFKYPFNPTQFYRKPKKLHHRCPESTRRFVVFMKQDKNYVRTSVNAQPTKEIVSKYFRNYFA
jgi:hypothetical protein